MWVCRQGQRILSVLLIGGDWCIISNGLRQHHSTCHPLYSCQPLVFVRYTQSQVSVRRSVGVLFHTVITHPLDTMPDSSLSLTPRSFLELPTEVRIEVYQHLFTSSILSIEPTYPSIPHCRYSICSCSFQWHIVVSILAAPWQNSFWARKLT